MRKRLDEKKQNRNKQLSIALNEAESSLCKVLNCNHNYISNHQDTKWFQYIKDNDTFQFDDTDSTDEFNQSILQNQINVEKEYWDTIPIDIDPSSGELNELRSYRKRSQVISLIVLIEEELKHRKEDFPVVIDFGAGSGHLSLLLAYRNPSIKVVLVERKEYSIINARLRIAKCNLSNVEIYLNDARDILSSGYLDRFDVGISLHSCGQLTDIALYLSIQSYASLVLTPCCYGQIIKPPPPFATANNNNNTINTNTYNHDDNTINNNTNEINTSTNNDSIINNNDSADSMNYNSHVIHVNKSIVDNLLLSNYPILQSLNLYKINQFHVLLNNDCVMYNNNDIKDITSSNCLLDSNNNTNETEVNNLNIEECFKIIVSGADYATYFEESQNKNDLTAMNEILPNSFLLAKKCMRLVDFDRCLHILKRIRDYNHPFHPITTSTITILVKPLYQNYKFRLASLRPLSCSPKNNVIIGRFLYS